MSVRVFGTILAALCLSGALIPLAGQDLRRARELRTHGVMMEAANEYEKYVLKSPNDAEARIEYVRVLLDLKRIDDSIPHIEALQAQKPNDPRVIEFMQLVKDRRDKLRRSRVDELKEKLAEPNPPPELYLEYARYLVNTDEYEKGVNMYNRYLTARPNDDNVRMELAKQYSWRKQYNSCNSQLNVLLNRNADNTDAWLLLGDILLWQNAEERALDAYQNALKSNPNSEKAKSQIRKITTAAGFRERQLNRKLEKNPTGPALLEMSRYYLESNRIFEAQKFVTKRLEAAPDDEQAQSLALEIQELIRAYQEKQLEEYRRRLTVNPNDSAALRAMGEFYTAQAQYPEAIEAYSTFLNRYPNDYQIRLRRAYVFSWSGQNSKAITEFRTIAFMAAYRREANLGLAEALMASNQNIEEAETIFRRDLTDFPEDNFRAKLGLAEAIRRQGRYDEAREIYEAVLKVQPGNEQALEGLDLLSRDTGPLLRNLERQLQSNPEDSDVIHRRLAGLYYDSDRIFEAEDQARIILERYPEDSRMLSLMERIQARKKQYLLEQIDKTRLEVQEKPTDDDLRIKLAMLLASNNQITEAVSQYKMVMQNRPTDFQLKLRLAEIYSAAQQWKEAADTYSQVADQFPNKFEYRFKSAQAYSWMGDYERAKEQYILALQLKPESLEAHLALANVYRWSGDAYTAHDEFSSVLTIDPDNQIARQALKEMTGAFFRGVQLQHTQSSDNEDFHFWETHVNAAANYSLKLQVRVGCGWIKFSQKDSIGYLASNEGNFLYGRMIYNLDPITRLNFEYRYNIYAAKNSDAFFIDLEHEFTDSPRLKGLTGHVFYSSQDAIIEVASTRGLSTWHKKLRADKAGFSGRYQTSYPVFLEGRLNYVMISDSVENTRTDVYISAGYPLSKHFNVGARLDLVSAKYEVPEYWSPSNYATYMGWINLKNKYSRWNYEFWGAIGRIRSSGELVRQFSVVVGYKLSNTLNAGGGYSSIYTSRLDGSYSYGRWALSLAWSR